jgi:hypothetical protein
MRWERFTSREYTINVSRCVALGNHAALVRMSRA